MEREARLQAFFAWLPEELRQIPGFDWSQLPAEVMGLCIRSSDTSPDAAYLAMAAATAFGAVTTVSLLSMLGNLKALFHTLRTECGMNHPSDLRDETLWSQFAAKTATTLSRSRQLSWYSAVSTKHYPRYLRGLEADEYFLMQQYQLPAMPDGFLRRVGKADELNNSSLQRRQPVRDTLVQLLPLLRQIVLLRKELAERLARTFRQVEREIQLATPLPFAFQYTDSFPELRLQGVSWGIQRREVTMCFLLWNKRSWVLSHQNRYSLGVIREAELACGVYSPERDGFFVQFDGAEQDLFWFGDLIKNRLMQSFQRGQHDDPAYEELWKHARVSGFPRGCTTQQPGLLRSDSRWFAEHASDGDWLFEPEAI